MEEKWITVKIGGYLRNMPKNTLPQIQTKLEHLKQEAMNLGIPAQEAEELYALEIVKDEP